MLARMHFEAAEDVDARDDLFADGGLIALDIAECPASASCTPHLRRSISFDFVRSEVWSGAGADHAAGFALFPPSLLPSFPPSLLPCLDNIPVLC